MKRRIVATVELMAFVDLDIEDEEQIQADPGGALTDGFAAETAIKVAIRPALRQDCDVFVFGEDHPPAKVYFDTIDIRIEGEDTI